MKNSDDVSVFEDSLTLNQGSVVFSEGEPSTFLYIIKSGRVRIVKSNNNKIIPISVLNPGSFLGEAAIFTDDARSASAIAIDDIDVIVIKKSDIKKAIGQCPDWVSKVMETLCDRLNQVSKILAEHQLKFNDQGSDTNLDIQEANIIQKSLEDYKKKRGI